MSENIHYLEARMRDAGKPLEARKRGGGGGGGGNEGGEAMDKRVEALEKELPEIREALTRIETTLSSFEKHVFPNLVTKADLLSETGGTSLAVANFRTEITRTEGTLIKWFIATALLLSGGVGAIAFGLARALK